MKEIENILTREWRLLSDNIDRIDPDKTGLDMHNINFNRHTALQRLAARYRRFAIMALCCMPMAMAFLNSSVFTGPDRVYSHNVVGRIIRLAAVPKDLINLSRRYARNRSAPQNMDVQKTSLAVHRLFPACGHTVHRYNVYHVGWQHFIFMRYNRRNSDRPDHRNKESSAFYGRLSQDI